MRSLKLALQDEARTLLKKFKDEKEQNGVQKLSQQNYSQNVNTNGVSWEGGKAGASGRGAASGSTLSPHSVLQGGGTTGGSGPSNRHYSVVALNSSCRLKPRSRIKHAATLKGHIAKVYSMHWASDCRRLVSAAQDGRLIVWDGHTSNKEHAIALRCDWVMTCTYSQSNRMVASGGLDNTVSIYNLETRFSDLTDKDQAKTPHKSLSVYSPCGHSAFISRARFVNSDYELLSSSGDGKCILWDLIDQTPKTEFVGHKSDVSSFAFSPDFRLFVTGGGDCVPRLWDLRLGQTVRMFTDLESPKQDINDVAYFPNGYAFATASEDSSVSLFDIRSNAQISKSDETGAGNSACSLAFSKSGRLVFVGYSSSPYLAAIDIINHSTHINFSPASRVHTSRVSSLGVTDDGYALCTASWDGTLRIWA
ncbi:guanine nucleotide-binding protein subunit beta-like [Symsagittifera roscoffensis]|uniref:guanine nucleotide-binding protein subunit beta-like n=1 Tax=Symsagittifera roscoffensis TaxID=84072 RepID=UPI00307B3E5D